MKTLEKSTQTTAMMMIDPDSSRVAAVFISLGVLLENRVRFVVCDSKSHDFMHAVCILARCVVSDPRSELPWPQFQSLSLIN